MLNRYNNKKITKWTTEKTTNLNVEPMRVMEAAVTAPISMYQSPRPS